MAAALLSLSLYAGAIRKFRRTKIRKKIPAIVDSGDFCWGRLAKNYFYWLDIGNVIGILKNIIAGWSSPVARRAHNPKVAGSNPAPATKNCGERLFFVYVIKSDTGRKYIGQTDNLEKRLRQHNEGRSFFTKRNKEWRLIFFEQYETRREAVVRERWLKSGAGRDYLKKILMTEPESSGL